MTDEYAARSEGSADHPRDVRLLIRCPICRARKQLDQRPELGLYLLCDGCLGVLLVDTLGTVADEALGVRALRPADIEEMPRGIYLVILEEKQRRLRKRLDAGLIARERVQGADAG